MFDVSKYPLMDKKTLVRSFSDEWRNQEPENTLSQSLAAKIEQDRKVDRARKEWTLLFTDAARIAECVRDKSKSWRRADAQFLGEFLTKIKFW
jgi:hypothetical protein